MGQSHVKEDDWKNLSNDVCHFLLYLRLTSLLWFHLFHNVSQNQALLCLLHQSSVIISSKMLDTHSEDENSNHLPMFYVYNLS